MRIGTEPHITEGADACYQKFLRRRAGDKRWVHCLVWPTAKSTLSVNPDHTNGATARQVASGGGLAVCFKVSQLSVPHAIACASPEREPPDPEIRDITRAPDKLGFYSVRSSGEHHRRTTYRSWGYGQGGAPATANGYRSPLNASRAKRTSDMLIW